MAIDPALSNIEGTPFHEHNGVDSPNIDPRFLKGFTVFTSAPTYTGKEGEIVLMDDGSSTRKLYAYLGGTWYSTTLS